MANRNALVGVFFIFVAIVFMMIALATPIWQHRKISTDSEVGGVTTKSVIVAQIGLLDWSYSMETFDGDDELKEGKYYSGSVNDDDANDAEYYTVDENGDETTMPDVPKSAWGLFAVPHIGGVALGTAVDDAVEPSAAVLGTGIVALLMGFVGFISMICVQSDKGPGFLKCATYLLFFGATFFLFVGTFVYARSVSLGYSYFFFAAGGIMLAMGIFQMLTVGTETIKAKYGASIFLFLGIVFLVVGMSTLSWVHHTQEDEIPQLGGAAPDVMTTTIEVGLLRYKQTMQRDDSEGRFISEGWNAKNFGSDEMDTYMKDKDNEVESTTTVEEEQSDQEKEYQSGGESVLGCGIPAVFCAVITFLIATALGCGKEPPMGKCLGFIVGGIACGLIGLGLFLYQTVVATGASFILYFLAGFLFIPGAIFGFSEGEQDGQDSTTKPEGGETTKV